MCGGLLLLWNVFVAVKVSIEDEIVLRQAIKMCLAYVANSRMQDKTIYLLSSRINIFVMEKANHSCSSCFNIKV